MEGTLHIDILSLFWCIWANPQTKIHQIVRYLLMMTNSASVTAHIKILFQLYQLPDPLSLICSSPWPKERWKAHTKAAVYHEQTKFLCNSKLGCLNVQVTGLAGRPHPVLSGILTTQDVLHSRVHIKMIAGDYPCCAHLGSDRNKDSACPLCQYLHPVYPAPVEDIVHLVTRCKATSETRSQYVPNLLNTIAKYCPSNPILIQQNHVQLTQLILDPTSLNLPLAMRICHEHPAPNL